MSTIAEGHIPPREQSPTFIVPLLLGVTAGAGAYLGAKGKQALTVGVLVWAGAELMLNWNSVWKPVLTGKQ